LNEFWNFGYSRFLTYILYSKSLSSINQLQSEQCHMVCHSMLGINQPAFDRHVLPVCWLAGMVSDFFPICCWPKLELYCVYYYLFIAYAFLGNVWVNPSVPIDIHICLSISILKYFSRVLISISIYIYLSIYL